MKEVVMLCGRPAAITPLRPLLRLAFDPHPHTSAGRSQERGAGEKGVGEPNLLKGGCEMDTTQGPRGVFDAARPWADEHRGGRQVRVVISLLLSFIYTLEMLMQGKRTETNDARREKTLMTKKKKTRKAVWNTYVIMYLRFL